MNVARLPATRREPVTVTLPNEIDIASAPSAELDIMAALGDGVAMVIAHLTATTFCDGAGARLLARAHGEATSAGADLRVAASPPVRRS